MAKDYERVEVTFSKTNEKDIKLFNHLEDNSEIIGKGRYIKKLISEDMKKKATKK